MKQHPPVEQTRFSGNLRHYHRSGSQTQRSWDDWVEGGAAKRKTAGQKWFRILGVSCAFLALAGLVTGLIIQLG